MGITDDIKGVVHNTHTKPLTHIVPAMTLQITDHLHIEALQLTPGIAADHNLDQPTNPPRKPYTNLCHIPADHKAKHISKGIQKLQYITQKQTMTVQMTIPVTLGRTQTI